MYKCTNYYRPEFESGILWNDPELNIDWHLNDIKDVLLSEKDKGLKTLKELGF